MSNVINFNAAKITRDQAFWEREYGCADGLELLTAMVNYQETRRKTGKLTPALISRGLALFQALERSAETHELRVLARNYKKHLEQEKQNS